MLEPAATGNAAEAEAAERRPLLAGRYRLRTPIGAGAAARVYLADDRQRRKPLCTQRN